MAKFKVKIAAAFHGWCDYGGCLGTRPVSPMPTENGIRGMIAAGMGIRREETEELKKLNEDIKITFEPLDKNQKYLERYDDFQTVTAEADPEALDIPKEWRCGGEHDAFPCGNGGYAVGKGGNQKNKVIQKSYVVNQEYTVYVQSENREKLKKVEYALNHPRFNLYCGRKNCPPAYIVTEEVADE